MTSDMWCNTLPALIGLVSGGLVAFIAHFFAARRERKNREHADKTAKEARKRNFIGFLDGFRAEAERRSPRDLSAVFPDRVYEFRREAAKIRGDIHLKKQGEFDDLIETLAKLRDSDVEEYHTGAAVDYVGRRRVTEAIDAIKNFVASDEFGV